MKENRYFNPTPEDFHISVKNAIREAKEAQQKTAVSVKRTPYKRLAVLPS